MEAGVQAPAPSLPASHGPQSQQNPGPGEERAQSQKLLRGHWQQDAIVRPQSRYFRGNQKHQLEMMCVCTLILSLSRAHTQTSASNGSSEGCGRGLGREGLAGEEAQGPHAAWALSLFTSWHYGVGSSCGVGWDVRINIHLPMHMDNAHSCPACFALIRTNCFRSGGRRAGER